MPGGAPSSLTAGEQRPLPLTKARSIPACRYLVEIVVYCESPECNASLYLAEELITLGFGWIEVMVGGWEEWEDMAYPTE